LAPGAARFGGELRRRRLAAGLALTDLSRRVHYSKAQLSKVERGLKPPSRELARLCDTALGASGDLAALVRPEPTTPLNLEDPSEEKEPTWFQPLSRRQAITVGLASVADLSISRPGSPKDDDATLLGMSRVLFDQYRKLGQVTSPRLLLPALVAQTRSLVEMASHTGPRTREGLLRLASRYAEFAGWMTQESGNDQAALWWTRRAVHLAAAGGDRDLAGYAYVRCALVTLYRDDRVQTIELARKAQNGWLPPRIRGLAAQREAQGHALAGDYDACMRSLDQARTLLASPDGQPDAPVIGTTHLTAPVAMITGWCLLDLGRPREAAEVIAGQMVGIPDDAIRTRVRYGMRQALAHALDGEIEEACLLTSSLLGHAITVSSVTISHDVRALARTLGRYPRNPAVRDLTPELGPTLQALISQT